MESMSRQKQIYPINTDHARWEFEFSPVKYGGVLNAIKDVPIRVRDFGSTTKGSPSRLRVAEENYLCSKVPEVHAVPYYQIDIFFDSLDGVTDLVVNPFFSSFYFAHPQRRFSSVESYATSYVPQLVRFVIFHGPTGPADSQHPCP